MTAASGLACAPKFRIGELRANPRRRAPTLLVFITGVYDTTDDVQSHRVIEVVRKRVGPTDSVVVYHETPSFMAGEFTAEFHERIANNPRYRKYEHRVLLGFSSGGTAALTYISRQPSKFHSVVLYAPYLGPHFIIDEINEAGGLRRWKPSGPIEDQELLWAWLRDYRVGQREKPSLWLLWGDPDDAAPGLDILRAHLPEERIITGYGDHGWEAFDRLWPRFVGSHPGVFR